MQAIFGDKWVKFVCYLWVIFGCQLPKGIDPFLFSSNFINLFVRSSKCCNEILLHSKVHSTWTNNNYNNPRIGTHTHNRESTMSLLVAVQISLLQMETWRVLIVFDPQIPMQKKKIEHFNLIESIWLDVACNRHTDTMMTHHPLSYDVVYRARL